MNVKISLYVVKLLLRINIEYQRILFEHQIK